MKRIVLVVEGVSDVRTAIAYADRVIQEEGLDPNVLKTCLPPITWSQASDRRRELGIKAHGHFNDEPGAPDAQNTRGVLMLLDRQQPGVDAVILMRDADRERKERRKGIEQARDEHEIKGRKPKTVVVGLASPKREAWVLVGFVPSEKAEAQALEEERHRLGFDPTRHSHRLGASTHGHDHDIKKCVLALGIGPDREDACYTTRPLAELRQRGQETGLPEYLDEVRDRLCPLLRQA